MICRTVVSSTGDLNSFLRGLLNGARSLEQIDQIHAHIVSNGFHGELPLITKLAEKLADLNSMRRARKLAFSVANPDLFLFNVLIRGYAQTNDGGSAVSLYHHLRRNTTAATRLIPDNFTYSFAMLACTAPDVSPEIGQSLHAHSIIDGFESNLFIGTAAVEMYLAHATLSHARKLFDRIPGKDTVLWNTMISGLIKNDRFDNSLEVFIQMNKAGVDLDSTSLASILPAAAAETKNLTIGKTIQSLAVKSGTYRNVQVATSLISMYSKSGDTQAAALLFDQIGKRDADVVAYNAMISCYSSNDEVSSAVELLKELIRSGGGGFVGIISPITIVALIPLPSPHDHRQFSMSVHGVAVKNGFLLNGSVSTSLITFYCRINEIETARTVFDCSSISDRRLESWNAMITGYVQTGMTKNAVSLFMEMQRNSIAPDPVTITALLSATAQIGAISLGTYLHDLIKREEIESNVYVSTALVDMYSKCGKLSRAIQVFDGIPQKNAVTYGTMISGLGLHGYGREAVSLFKEMSGIGSAVKPTRVTFLSVLYACSHSGLVSQGEEIFDSMIRIHNVNPMDEHYACMVDMFGRAGLLNRAMEFIEGLPVEPGPTVWGTLLGACRMQNDSVTASVAMKKLTAIGGAGYDVLMSNVWSASEDYHRAASVREKMDRNGKTPGLSFIETGSGLNRF